MKSGGDDDEGMNDINIVPFVDIVLVLLIVFMVTTEFVRDQAPKVDEVLPQQVAIALPKAGTGSEMVPSLVSVAMDRSGGLYLNGAATDMTGIRTQVAKLQAEGKAVQAFVAADEGLTHGAVLAVIDALRTLGVGQVGLNTKPLEIE